MKAKTGKGAAPEYEECCVSFNLRRSSLVVSRIYAQEMRDSPVRGPLFTLMMIIGRRGPSSISELAREIGLDRTTLTRNLKPLEQRGLVRVSPVDANRKEVSLLPDGQAALASAVQGWRRAQSRVVRELGEERWNRLRGDLAAVMALGDT